MKRIVDYKKLLNVQPDTDLKQLKVLYRNLMKQYHPDKFLEEAEKEAAEKQSKVIIEAYSFLVSIHPETHATNVEEYTIATNSPIDDFQYKLGNLKITFLDGSVYEYLGVPKNIYNKLANSPTLARFARRHIYNSYTYRNINKQTVK